MRVDATGFPLVRQILDGKQTDEDLDAFAHDLGQVFARREPFVALIHIRDYAINWSHLGRLASKMKHMPSRYCRGAALAVASPTFRFVLSSYYLLHMPQHPVVVFDEVPPAEAWALQKLKDEGLPIPEALRNAG